MREMTGAFPSLALVYGEYVPTTQRNAMTFSDAVQGAIDAPS
jgi:hypothetical protein